MKTITNLSQFLCLMLLAVSSYAQTNVGGVITSSATWTKSGSPYIITKPTVFTSTNSLTIEPGVVVKFADSSYIEMTTGLLSAVGTATDSIYFISNNTNPSKGIYRGLVAKAGKVKLDYCVFEYAELANDFNLYALFPIQHCAYRYNNVCLSSLSNLTMDKCFFFYGNNDCAWLGQENYVTNCIFVNNRFGLQSGSVLKNCIFYGNSSGASYFDTVVNCQFVNNNIGYFGQFRAMRHNVFTQNKIGISCSVNLKDTMTENDVYRNEIGFKLDHSYSKGSIYNNRFCKNTKYNAFNTQKTDNNLENNCWCETDSNVIAYKLLDRYDSITVGLSTFVPFNSCDSVSVDTITLRPNDIPSAANLGYFSTNISRSELKLYPNPARQILTVEQAHNNAYIQIFDITGRIQWQSRTSVPQTQINIDFLIPGIYILRLNDQTAKFVKE